MNNSNNEIDMAFQTMESLKTKALLADVLLAGSGSISVSELADMLKQSGVITGKERMFTWLRANGYVSRLACGMNVPTQESLDMGIMEQGCPVRITPKGQWYLFEKVMNQKDTINAMEAAKKAAKIARDSENRRNKRQRQAC